MGRIRDVRISNFTVRNAGTTGSSITAIPDYYVEGVVLDNISIHHKGGVTKKDITEKWRDERVAKYPEGTAWGTLPAKGFFIRHARNIKFSNIKITTDAPDERPDFVEIDTFDVTVK